MEESLFPERGVRSVAGRIYRYSALGKSFKLLLMPSGFRDPDKNNKIGGETLISKEQIIQIISSYFMVDCNPGAE
jgi:hypothetical protein